MNAVFVLHRLQGNRFGLVKYFVGPYMIIFRLQPQSSVMTYFISLSLMVENPSVDFSVKTSSESEPSFYEQKRILLFCLK